MKIEIIKVGSFKCNCYILDINSKVLVIDPGDEFSKIVDAIGDRELVGIIITHYHFDHIGALEELVNKYNITVYDKNNLLTDINKINLFKFEVIPTPGHKEDAITIYFKEDNIMFCGDFIFKDGIGRCDLPGGDYVEMLNSINKMKLYSRDITLYPGHGDSTNLGYEIDNNMYLLDVNLL